MVPALVESVFEVVSLLDRRCGISGTRQAPPSQIFDQSASLASGGRRGQCAVQSASAIKATVRAEKAGGEWCVPCSVVEETETRREPVLQAQHLECNPLTEATECAVRNFPADEVVAVTAHDAVKSPAPRAALFRPFSDHVVTKSVQTGASGVSDTSQACCGTGACGRRPTASLDPVKGKRAPPAGAAVMAPSR